MKRHHFKRFAAAALAAALAIGTAVPAMAETQKAGWYYEDGIWYLLDSDGDERTGWQQVNGTWYYLSESGAMARNQWVGNYYLGADGAMLTNTTTPDGYQVGADGAWIAGGSSSGSAGTSSSYAYTIDDVDADYAVEADVNVVGGNGGVGKLVILSPYAACAIDIVDNNDQTYFWRENIYSNAAGGQDYKRLGDTGKGQTRHMMLAYNTGSRTGQVYIDGNLIDTFQNDAMVTNNPAYVFATSVEAGAKVNGSSVNAVFTNIRLKSGGQIRSSMFAAVQDNNPGLHSDTSLFDSQKKITISGTVQLADGVDWDMAYNSSSGKVSFY